MAEGSPSILHVSLSRFQTIVGLLAGLVSVFGAVYSVPQFFKPAPGMGEVVALVQEAKSEKAVAGATIEILTAQNALVTTLTPDSLGQVRHALKEGLYRVRVSHPRFSAEVRQIQVFSGQTVEVRVRLRAGSSFSLRRLLGL
ncbi:MAG: carboxypeptidase-like regulatory domain-containing protein [Candidatus Rokuibacteriota bacterium]